MRYSNGSLLDWSGVTGIALCQGCTEVMGPYLSYEETAASAGAHWAIVHRGETVPRVEDIAPFEPDTCWWDELGTPECEGSVAPSGYCRRHTQIIYHRNRVRPSRAKAKGVAA